MRLNTSQFQAATSQSNICFLGRADRLAVRADGCWQVERDADGLPRGHRWCRWVSWTLKSQTRPKALEGGREVSLLCYTGRPLFSSTDHKEMYMSVCKGWQEQTQTQEKEASLRSFLKVKDSVKSQRLKRKCH